MMNRFFHLDISAGELIVRAIVVYLGVLILLRAGGKRQLGQMGPTEFVAMLLISNAVQNAMNGGDNSLLGGMILAAVIILLSTAISYLTFRFRGVSAIFEGTPTLLIYNGKVIHKHLIKERLNEHELKTLLRKQGVHDIHSIKNAILESDGTFSITKFEEKPPVQHSSATPSEGQ